MNKKYESELSIIDMDKLIMEFQCAICYCNQLNRNGGWRCADCNELFIVEGVMKW